MISPQVLHTHLPNARLACSFFGQATETVLLPIIFRLYCELENLSMYVLTFYFFKYWGFSLFKKKTNRLYFWNEDYLLSLIAFADVSLNLLTGIPLQILFNNFCQSRQSLFSDYSFRYTTLSQKKMATTLDKLAF